MTFHSGIGGGGKTHTAIVDRGLINPLGVFPSHKLAAAKAREGKLQPHEFQGGTFSISNLGMFGVSSFVSILPPGQGAIMAVAASTPTAVLQKNGMIGMVKQMTVTITADHRHIYGADAAKFLGDLADLLENDTMSLLM